jgi:lipoate---protein ligase
VFLREHYQIEVKAKREVPGPALRPKKRDALVQFLDRTLPTLEQNLALDEALLLEAEAATGSEILRLWEWERHAVVLGAASRLARDVFEPACQADAVPIARRASGGGTVLLGPGCLLYSLVLSYRRSPELEGVRNSYRYILGTIGDAVAALAPEVEVAGISDLAAAGRKFSGNSQQRKRRHLLHHGTILYAFDATCAARYLPMPLRRPDYRGNRTHSAFLTNVAATAEVLRDRIRLAWNANEPVSDWPSERVSQLVREKYGRREWNRRL